MLSPLVDDIIFGISTCALVAAIALTHAGARPLLSNSATQGGTFSTETLPVTDTLQTAAQSALPEAAPAANEDPAASSTPDSTPLPRESEDGSERELDD